MPRGAKQKQKLLYLSKIFLEETDEDHPLTMPEIIAKLNGYGIEADRKSLYNDIDVLQEFGIEIMKERNGSVTDYYCGSREFEVAELKFLVDAIQSSKFLTENKTKELIKKLGSLVSNYDAKFLERRVLVSGRIKNMDGTIYYVIDTLHTAISKGKKIRFKYFGWDINGEKKYRNSGDYYIISPWALYWDNENYYLIAYDSKAQKIKHFRVDKIDDYEILDEVREGKKEFEAIDKSQYTRKLFHMFDGEEQHVTLKCTNAMSNVIVDQFGKDVRMKPIKGDEEHFLVNVDVVVSPQFFGWIFGLGGNVIITQPESVKKQMQEQLIKVYAE
ncbi:MAG: WYL domain-containing protein [Eubacterium sp.]|nr:WYL domain-containing protein [Eubacterium sp.]